VPARVLEPETCLPAVGQGALAIECRTDDREVRDRLSVLDHAPSHLAVEAERAFLRRLGGGCLAPAASYGIVRDGRLWLRAIVGDPDGAELLRDEERAANEEIRAAGERLAVRMLEAGAGPLLARVRDEADGPVA